MTALEFGCRPTMIGSLPHKDPDKACQLVARYFPDFPAWPQLPNRSFTENMYNQFSEGFPGVVINENNVCIDGIEDLADHALETLYRAYQENDIDQFRITAEYAAGLHSFLSLPGLSRRAVKGQVTGPVTWGLSISFCTGSYPRPILFNDAMADGAATLLRMKATWQERELKKVSPNTMIFVDEPYLASFGSSYTAISREKVIGLLNEVFAGISGVKGIHCCGAADWSVLLRTSTQILSFDAYKYAHSLSLYPAEVNEFLERRGGAIAWGIVPTAAEELQKETVSSLKDRLEAAMAPFTHGSISFRQLLAQGLLTPSCGLAGLTEEGAIRALELLADLSKTIRQRYL